ncbi:DEAD/DEAH box helicase [Bacteroides fragilis]|jgi:SWI/SNF-related matrix-associated actin-dependent regulator 1 of chromatin subfamily A|uniref:DEAD/DEAH box helicase n=1 Tax=Bacteroides fragilis TaxID=817 RepID=UPI00202F09C0|nr:SNF2-related protein [Bacteroides fragilis]MCM0248096.1 DEAD/DEAH box helicase family protein [Bacteroides fragilis]MCM0256882.1 DEAD/DEAH box helicase family protein [Bacteroides fragilis]
MKPIYVTKTPNLYRIQFEYHPKLVEVIKTIPSKPRYDGTDRAWLVSINDSRYPFGKDAAWYVGRFAQWAVHMQFCSVVKQREVTEDINYDLPDMKPFVGEHYMLLQPYQYQLEGVQYAVEKKRCILGDQPGLGKTLQAICTVVKAHREAVIYGESFPTLVVCPAALKVNWQREFKKFAGLSAIILDDSNRQTWHSFYDCKKADGSPLCEVFITNYESLKKFFVKRVSEGGKLTMKGILFDERVNLFKSVIIDESHKCKSGKTQQGKFVEGICKGKRFLLALTGTPVVNNNTDLIQQLKILGRLEDFGGYSRFVERYCDGPKQASNVKELNWRLWNCCFFRREKSKVLTQLPDKTRQYLQIDITNMKEYQSAESDIVKYLKQYKNASDAQVQRFMNGAVMVKMGLLKQISARGKIKAVSEFIHDVIDGGEKLIVFGYLKEVIAELKKEFPNAVTVTGSDNISQKQFAVDSFQNNPDCKLIILNYKSGGTGLTLTASSRVAFIEFPWTFSDCEQAEDRAHRNGQKNNVNCYYFLGKDTIDKYMYDVIQTKKNIANGVTGTDDQVEENMVNLAMDLFRDKL